MRQSYPTALLSSLLLLSWPAFAPAQTCLPTTVTAFPYVENFDAATAPDVPCGLTVSNVNADASTWATIGNNASSAPNAIRYNYSNTADADDWFFTPGLQCRAGATYQVQFRYRATLASFPEALEVRLGTTTTPSVPQTELLFSNLNITNTSYLTAPAGTGAGQVASFTPAATGIYYVGFRALSPANRFYLYVDDIRITEDAPLPVQLTAFEAEAAGPTAVRLTWTTATELNSAYFEAERSLDGEAFEPVGRVVAAGSSAAAHTYAFTDEALPAAPGPLYYRLRQVDVDGTTAFSPVRSVARPAAELAFYPNPVGGTAIFTCRQATTLTVRDALGRRCQVLALSAGTQAVDLTALPAGSYTLTNEATHQTLRLFRQP